MYYFILKCLNVCVSDCYKRHFKDSFPYMGFSIVDVWVLFCPFRNTDWSMFSELMICQYLYFTCGCGNCFYYLLVLFYTWNTSMHYIVKKMDMTSLKTVSANSGSFYINYPRNLILF